MRRLRAYLSRLSTAKLAGHLSSGPDVEEAGPENAFLSLPAEIVLSISRYLPPESSISLRLTCKQLFALPPSILDDGTKHRLLCLLERDFPNLINCRYCNKLFQWRDRWKTVGCRNRQTIEHAQLLYLGRSFLIFEEERDLMLRAHELGPDYGMPLCTLRQLGQTDDPEAAHMKLDVGILDGRMLLCHVAQLRFTSADDLFQQAQKLMDTAHIPDSSYLDFPGAALCLMHTLLNQATHTKGGARTRKIFSPLLHSGGCPVDVRIGIVWRKNIMQATVICYMDLGSRGEDLSAKSMFAFYPRGPVDKYLACSRNLEKAWLQCRPDKAIYESCEDFIATSLDRGQANVVYAPSETSILQDWPTQYMACGPWHTIKLPRVTVTATTDSALRPWLDRWNDTVSTERPRNVIDRH